MSVNEAQPTRLGYSTAPNNMTLTLATGETRSVDFGDWNARPTYLPLILR